MPLKGHILSIVLWHLPPNSARIGYALTPLKGHILSIVLWHLPPNSARIGYVLTPLKGHILSIVLWHLPPNSARIGYVLTPLKGFFYLRAAAVRRRCQRPPKGFPVNWLNMPDPIRKRFCYGQLWPLRPACSHNRAGSRMPVPTSRIRFSSIFPNKAWVVL